jgi:hypothetical protein
METCDGVIVVSTKDCTCCIGEITQTNGVTSSLIVFDVDCAKARKVREEDSFSVNSRRLPPVHFDQRCEKIPGCASAPSGYSSSALKSVSCHTVGLVLSRPLSLDGPPQHSHVILLPLALKHRIWCRGRTEEVVVITEAGSTSPKECRVRTGFSFST